MIIYLYILRFYKYTIFFIDCRNYVNIKFNRQEIDDMIRLVSLYITDNAPRIKDAELYYVIGFAIKSFSCTILLLLFISVQ